MTEKNNDEKARLSSVTTALRLLKAFTPSDSELGITALSKRLSLATSTVHRLATTLAAEGFLVKNNESGRYKLGLALFSLGAMVRRRMDVSNLGLPYLDFLRNKSNETVYLTVLDGSSVVYLFSIASAHAIRPRSYIGERKPALATSEGRAILAFSPPALADSALAEGLEPRTPKTNTDLAALREMLKSIRAEGYATEYEESEEGICGIGAPIRDFRGDVVAAVGLGVPVQRMNADALAVLVPLVIETAGNISTQLGYSG